jgi:hypothetical protein
VVYAVQGEKNSRKIRFDLFNGGIQWEIDRNASVLISYKKADGHGGVYDVLDNGEKAFEFAYGSTNSVIITLAEQVLTTVGAVSLLVSFVLDDEIISTFNIVLDVSENPGIDVAESEDYFSLSAAIDAAKKVVGEMLDPNAFASKEYVDGVIGDLREDLDEISDDARVFYVTISKSDDGSFAADKSVDVIRSAYDNGRTVKAVVDDDGEQVTIPLIAIIEGDTVMYVGYGAYSNRIVVSQTDILVSVHNDALPNVKTVNGTAPDEHGNVELDISSGGGGGGGGGYARNKLVYSLTLTEQLRYIEISFTPEQQAILKNANGYAIALNLLSGEGVVAENKNPGNVDIRPGYRHDAIQLAGAVPTDKTNVTEITSVGYVDRRLANILPNGGSVLVRTVVRAKVSPSYTHPNTRCTTDFENEFTITLDYPVGIGSSVKVYAIDVAGV